MNIATLDWDDELLAAMDVPRAMLPKIVPSSQVYGEAGGFLAGVPVAGALGDQQAALFGQTCSPRGGEVHLRHRVLPAAQHRHHPDPQPDGGC